MLSSTAVSVCRDATALKKGDFLTLDLPHKLLVRSSFINIDDDDQQISHIPGNRCRLVCLVADHFLEVSQGTKPLKTFVNSLNSKEGWEFV